MRLPRVGERFQGRFEIAEVLGRGGFACVYLARDVEMSRDVALKVLAPTDSGYRGETAQRFMREARVLAQLDEPHAITLFDFGRTDEGLLFMVFEYVRGRDLAVLLEEQGALPPPVAEHILRQVLAALHAAHRLGVLHRDIKPANIIIFEYAGDRYRVKLIDFGIAKPILAPSNEPRTLTQDGALVGTPRWMAPEQFFGDELTPSADLYSLGLVVHEMLLGHNGVLTGGADEVVSRKLSATPILLPDHVGTPALRAVVDRMTARDVRARFPSAHAALVALDGGTPRPRANSDAVGAAEPKATETRGGPPVVVLGVAVLVALIAVAAVLAILGPTEPSSPPPTVVTRRPAPVFVTDEAAPRAPAVDDEPSEDSGCGRPAEPGLRRRALFRGLLQRELLVYVPAAYDENVRHPVVMMFHRDSTTADSFLRDSRMHRQADESGFVIVAFDAMNKASPFTESEESAFVAEALRALEEDLCVDPQRRYAVGDGSGGRFARNLACKMPLSAVAETGSGVHLDESLCASTPPTPLIRLWGDKDPDVPPKGGAGCGSGRPFLSAAEIARGWRERNECRGGAQTWFKHSGGTCRRWECAATFAECELDGGHDWPDMPPPAFEMPKCEVPAPKFPFTEAIWQFFEAHGRVLDAPR